MNKTAVSLVLWGTNQLQFQPMPKIEPKISGVPVSAPKVAPAPAEAVTSIATESKSGWGAKSSNLNAKIAERTAAPNLTGFSAPKIAAPVPVSSVEIAAAPSLAVAFDNIKAPGGPAQSRMLSNGMDAWNARMDIIENAKTSIDASYFIVEKDPFGFAFLGGLLKKQMQGVPVQLSIDAMADTFGKNGFKASFKGQDYLQEIVNHGGKGYVYHPVTERIGDAFKLDYSVLSSNHDKILVADGKVGITGGRNIAQDYFADPKDLKGAWRDMDVQMEGAGAAAGLKEAFDAELANGGASKPVSKDLFGNWDKKDIQLLGAYEMMNNWLKAPAFSEAQKAELRADNTKLAALSEELVNSSLSAIQNDLPEKLKRAPSDKDMTFLREQAGKLVSQLEARGSKASFDAGAAGNTRQTDVKIIDQTSAAAGQRINNIAPALTAMVEGATKRITIENPYVVLTDDMLKGLERASKRGVKIEIITNSPLSTDSDVTQAFFLEDWPMILAKCPTAQIFVATGDRKFHTKSAVIDDDQTFISTYNLDLLSGYVNGEVGALVKSKELADDLNGAFAADKSDPANGFIEYKIQKDAQGNAILKDGKPVIEFGPENHLPKDILEKYAKKRNLWGNTIRNNVPQFKPLRHEG
jgi:cardiolipin synthase C